MVNEHDEQVRIDPARPGSLTTCLGSNSEQVGDLLFRKLIAPRRVTRVCVTCSMARVDQSPGMTGGPPTVHGNLNVFTISEAKQ